MLRLKVAAVLLLGVSAKLPSPQRLARRGGRAAAPASSTASAEEGAADKASSALSVPRGGAGGESFLTGLLSGACAGTAVDLVLFPLDTVKTRLQAGGGGGGGGGMALVGGIFNGLLPAIAASAPCAGAFFAAYDQSKQWMADWHPKYAALVPVCAAVVGDLTQSVVRVPFEVCKTRVQAGVSKTGLQAAKAVLAERGAAGFFTGWSSMVLRDLPFDIIQFPLYEFLKKETARRNGGTIKPWQSSLCGSCAGAIASGLTTPLDVAKTRLMTDATKYTGVWQCLTTVAAEEGAGALFSGVVPRVLMISFGGAIFFGAYEAAKENWVAPMLARRAAN